MSKKKKTPAKPPAGPAKKNAPPKRPSKTPWIIGAAVILLVIAGYAASRGGEKGAGSAGALVATPEEAKYIGRFLPEGYAEPKIGDGGAVTADTRMTPIQAAVDDTGLSVAVADVVSNRNVAFEFKKADGTAVPMIAYVKPSGKLFLGVSFCVPCQGTGQTLTTDGMLTCDSCGTKRDPESGIGVSGACKLYPLDELPAKVAGDRITVEKAALDNWTVQPTDRKVGG